MDEESGSNEGNSKADFDGCPADKARYRTIVHNAREPSTFNDLPEWCNPPVSPGSAARRYTLEEDNLPPYTHCIRSIGEYGSSTRALQILKYIRPDDGS